MYNVYTEPFVIEAEKLQLRNICGALKDHPAVWAYSLGNEPDLYCRPPTAQHFWAASASGVGQQTVTWKVREGDWSVVLMNADGSRPLVADIDLGAKLAFLLWLAIGLLLGGVFVLVGSSALVVLAARRRQAPPMPPAPATASSGAGSTRASESAGRPDQELPPD